ncbi:YgjV family protein [uncultured Croceitalea sp.]|uniref:YgjV family protein n=1 Tax=uncultured Croceitalea sp. TaxID=1798908 RepID=UPI003305A1BF
MVVSFAELVGYIALLLNLYSMSAKNERKLRLVSLVANLIYVFYGIMISATPIIAGCTVAVLLHAYRLYKLKSNTYETHTIS